MKLEIFRKLESDEIEFEKSLGLRSGRVKRGKIKKINCKVHVCVLKNSCNLKLKL